MHDKNAELKKHCEQVIGSLFNDHYQTHKNILHDAMAYAVLGEGKRVRAQLCYLVCELFDVDYRNADRAAVALEMLHAYSLVHDDLPCLDNDSMRRGRPTAHVKFDEATALLAGDGLLTDAFRVVSDSSFTNLSTNLTSEQQLNLVRTLSSAAGAHGMVDGQMSDVYWTNRSGAGLDQLKHIHLNKTGRLLGAACAMGAASATLNKTRIAAFQQFGEDVGMSFQIIDDLLDNTEGTGKAKGKDLAQKKLTYPSLVGQTEAQELAKQYTQRALSVLESFGSRASILKSFIESLLHRRL